MTSDNHAAIIELYHAGAEDEEIAMQLDLPIDEVADVIDAYDAANRPGWSPATLVAPAPIVNLRTFILLCIANYDQDAIYEMFENQCSNELRNQIYSLADPSSCEPLRSAMINMGFTDY